jgi:isocitrate lyase
MRLYQAILLVIFHAGFSLGLSVPAPKRLQQLLQAEMDGSRRSDMPILMPCCYDGLTARLVARAGFEATFMTGFGVSAVNGYPDTQLVSYSEMQSAASTVAEGLSSAALELGKEPIPCIADGDTGYGNAVNVKRVSIALPKSTFTDTESHCFFIIQDGLWICKSRYGRDHD